MNPFRKNKATVWLLIAALLLGSGITAPDKAQAAKKSKTSKEKLSSKKLTLKKGQTKTLKVKNAQKKIKWSIVSGKKYIKLKSKKKASVKVVGKKAGKAKVQAKGKKKLICKVTVQGAAGQSGKSSGGSTGKSTGKKTEGNGTPAAPTNEPQTGTQVPPGGSTTTSEPTGTPPRDENGRNTEDVTVLKKLIAEQRARGAAVSEDLDSEEYTWSEGGDLTEINWSSSEEGKLFNLSGNISFVGLKNLKTIDVASSKLTSVDVSSNLALKELDCSDNQLSSLDVSSNPVLEELDCSDNQLSSLDVSSNLALKDLDCSWNELSSLDVSRNPALQELWCDEGVTVTGCSEDIIHWCENPNSTPTATPQKTPDPTPSVTPQGTPDPTPTATPQETPDPTPSVTPQETPDPTPTATPEPGDVEYTSEFPVVDIAEENETEATKGKDQFRTNVDWNEEEHSVSFTQKSEYNGGIVFALNKDNPEKGQDVSEYKYVKAVYRADSKVMLKLYADCTSVWTSLNNGVFSDDQRSGLQTTYFDISVIGKKSLSSVQGINIAPALEDCTIDLYSIEFVKSKNEDESKGSVFVKVAPEDAELDLNGKDTVRATATADVSGCEAMYYSWSSEDEGIAQVWGDGSSAIIFGLSVGSTRIRCTVTTDTGISEYGAVTVTVRDTSLGVSEDGSVTMTAANLYAAGMLVTDSEDHESVDEPTYNEDGSITFTSTNQSNGGGVGFYFNPDHSTVDMSKYSGIEFVVSSPTAGAGLKLSVFTNPKPDSGIFSKLMGNTANYGYFVSEEGDTERTYTVDFAKDEKWNNRGDGYAVLIGYNAYEVGDYDNGDIRYATFTIHSVKLISATPDETTDPTPSVTPQETPDPTPTVTPEPGDVECTGEFPVVDIAEENETEATKGKDQFRTNVDWNEEEHSVSFTQKSEYNGGIVFALNKDNPEKGQDVSEYKYVKAVYRADSKVMLKLYADCTSVWTSLNNGVFSDDQRSGLQTTYFDISVIGKKSLSSVQGINIAPALEDCTIDLYSIEFVKSKNEDESKGSVFVKVAPEDAELDLNGKDTVRATATADVSGCEAMYYSWSSEDEGIAQVWGDGSSAIIFGLSVGSTRIRCTVTTDTGISEYGAVTVTVRDTSLGVSEDGSVTMTAANLYAAGMLVTDSEDHESVDEPTYNEDGSITFTSTNQSNGGGVGFYFNPDHSTVDMSKYSGIEFVVSSPTAGAGLKLSVFTNPKPDSGIFSKLMGNTANYGYFVSEEGDTERTYTVDFAKDEKWNNRGDGYAVLIGYNAYEVGDYDNGDIRYATFTIHSVKLIKAE